MTDEVRILIVEDDDAIATGIALNLKLEGYVAVHAQDGEVASAHLDDHDFSLVLLDIMMPKKTGLDVLREMRERHDVTPVIVLSAREHEYDKVAALRLGADDYVTKPFKLAELLARVHAVLRRAQLTKGQNSGRIVRFADVAIDLDQRVASKGDEPVRLTNLEFELLRFFVTNPHRVIGRGELLTKVWGQAHGGSRRTVDNFVAQLRSKLEADAEAPQHFVTVRGAGYRFEPSSSAGPAE